MEKFYVVCAMIYVLLRNFEVSPVLVSQFTLLASTKKGSKPDFHGALGGEQAKELYELFFSKIQQGYNLDRVKDGVFQAMMVRL